MTTTLAPALELDSPLQGLPGVGPRRAERLREAGLETVEDLLFHLPFRYEDRTRCSRIFELAPGLPATIRARLLSPRLIRTRRRGFTIFEAILDDGSGAIRSVWYNQPYLDKVLVSGREGFFYGEPRLAREGMNALVLQNPEFELLGEEEEPEETIHTGRIVPVYRSASGLGGRALRRLIHQALSALGDGIEDFLPSEIRRKLSLTWRGLALRSVHFPPSDPSADTSMEELSEGASPYHRRLIFEEFFLLQVGLALRRRQRRLEERGFRYRFTEETRRKLAALLPFPLTRAQKRVLREIQEDMEGPAPMNRLLQGDVGSGKTVIAALTLAIAAENGLQGALMAPTEILAEQHHRKLEALLRTGAYTLDLLTSSVRGAGRRKLLERVESGETSILIGTQALIGSSVRFARLGLVVVDEQHRFGVVQRAALREKGYRPDILVMTATPIPRSLSLTVYGDLEHSLLDEMPPGRQTIKTLLRAEEHRDRVYEGIRRELARGRQAFIIYPLVEEKEQSELKAAVEMAERLQRGPFADLRVACMHGRMNRPQRDETMAAFARGEIQVLVATTVVEVGIDVPNATVLVVEHPERFGLSQLHQLRGRVGRGSEKAYCILMLPEKLSEEARRRVEVLANESDGFRIAQKDLEFRGPGDILGTRQHGLPALRAGNLIRDASLMTLARREASAFVERLAGGEAKLSRALAQRLERRWQGRFNLLQAG
ncbi:MAG: DNA helicase RecG [Acidobacteria bacterium]|nr:MAG: DNA helicase RecG [Acidobacteriota bacterium]